jgi:hypothetical protein
MSFMILSMFPFPYPFASRERRSFRCSAHLPIRQQAWASGRSSTCQETLSNVWLLESESIELALSLPHCTTT